MDFDLTEEHRMFQKFIRDFAEKEIAPLVDEAEENNVFPRQLFKMMGDMGFLCPRYPEELGGGGGDKITECIMAEELNKINAGIAASLMVQGGLSTQPIYRFGSEEQKQKIQTLTENSEKIQSESSTAKKPSEQNTNPPSLASELLDSKNDETTTPPES